MFYRQIIDILAEPRKYIVSHESGPRYDHFSLNKEDI